MKKTLFNDYAICQGKIYYFNPVNQLPSKVDVKTGKITYIENLDHYYKKSNSSIDITINHNGIIYALENAGDDLLIYDIKNNSCKHIEIHYSQKPWGNFAYVCGVNEGIYIFPRHKSEILYVEKEENVRKIKYDSSGLGEIICGCKMGNRIYLFPKEGNKCILFDIELEVCERISLEIKFRNIVSCTTDLENIYILDAERNVFVLDTKRKTLNQLDYRYSYKSGETVGKILFAANKLIIFPSLAQDIQILDLATNKVEEYSKYPEDFSYYKDVLWSKYYGCTEDETYYYLLRKSNYMLLLNKETAALEWIKLSVPDETEEMKAQLAYGKQVFYEKNSSMAGFISNVLQFEDKKLEKKTGVGKAIWEEIE